MPRPPVPELLVPHECPPPRRGNRLLRLLEAYRFEPSTLSAAQQCEVKTHLQLLSLTFGDERLAFAEARFIDHETVCMVFTGEPGGLCALPTRANLLVDQDWNLSGGIVFRGLHAEPVKI